MESALYGIFTLVGFVSEISLVRCAALRSLAALTNSCENPVRTRFHEVISVLTFPTKSTSMVNRVITQFVWNKIRYRTMIAQGGLDMPDFRIINEVLKVVWVRKGLLKTKCASEKGLLVELQKRRYDHSR